MTGLDQILSESDNQTVIFVPKMEINHPLFFVIEN